MFVHSHPLFLGDKFRNDISSYIQVNKQTVSPTFRKTCSLLSPKQTEENACAQHALEHVEHLLISILCHSWISTCNQVAQQFKYIFVIYHDPDSTNHTTDSIFNFHVFQHSTFYFLTTN
jgi:hypothetical protein